MKYYVTVVQTLCRILKSATTAPPTLLCYEPKAFISRLSLFETLLILSVSTMTVQK